MFLYLYFSKKKADNLVFFSPSVTVCIFHATQISLKNDLLFSFGKLWQQQQYYYYYYCVGSASLVHNCKTVLKLISFKNVFVSRLHKQALASFIFLYSLKLWTFARFIWNSYCNSVLNRMPILKHSTLIIYGSRVVTYNPKVLIKLFTRGTAMTKFHFIPSRPLSYVVVNTCVSGYIQTLRYNLNLPTGFRSQSSSLFGINNFIVGPWWW